MERKRTIVIDGEVGRTALLNDPKKQEELRGRLWRIPEGIPTPGGPVMGYRVISPETRRHQEAAIGAAKMLQEFLRSVDAPLMVDDFDGQLANPNIAWDCFEVRLVRRP